MIPGTRVRYTAKWLRNTGQYTGPAPLERGTVVGPIPGMSSDIVGVRWDSGPPSWADPEYLAHVEKYGVAVNIHNLERWPR